MNVTLNRITHLGVEGAITVAINFCAPEFVVVVLLLLCNGVCGADESEVLKIGAHLKRLTGFCESKKTGREKLHPLQSLIKRKRLKKSSLARSVYLLVAVDLQKLWLMQSLPRLP